MFRPITTTVSKSRHVMRHHHGSHRRLVPLSVSAVGRTSEASALHHSANREFSTILGVHAGHSCTGCSSCSQPSTHHTPLTTRNHDTTLALHRHHPFQNHNTLQLSTPKILQQTHRWKSDTTNPGEGNAGAVVPGDDEGTEEVSIPGAQKGGRKLAIVYTCTVCDTRSIKQFTENAYNNGVVIVQCPGCQNRHLIADNLGFFEDMKGGWNIEKAVSEMGENVRVVNDNDVLELSVEDIYGEEKIQKAATGESDEK